MGSSVVIEILAVILVGGIAALAFLRWRRAQADAALVQTFTATFAQARSTLPEAQIVALTAEMHEIKQIERAMLDQGVDARSARRMAMQGCIRSMQNHIELNRLLPG